MNDAHHVFLVRIFDGTFDDNSDCLMDLQTNEIFEIGKVFLDSVTLEICLTVKCFFNDKERFLAELRFGREISYLQFNEIYKRGISDARMV